MLLDKQNILADCLASAILNGATGVGDGVVAGCNTIDLESGVGPGISSGAVYWGTTILPGAVGGVAVAGTSYATGASTHRRRTGNLRVYAQVYGADVAAGTNLTINIMTHTLPPTTAVAGTQVASSGVILTGTMVNGYRFPLEISQDTALLRFLGIQFVQVGTSFTAGSILVAVVPEGDAQTANRA
jgi:hypothetical protein